MYDYILMDLDNTILDFDAAEQEGFRNIVKIVDLEYSDQLLEDYKRINTSLWSDLEQGKITRALLLNTRFHRFFQLYGLEVDGRALEAQYRSYLDNSSGLVPNAKDTLLELRNMGKKVYSASNGVYSTQIKRLTNAGILDLFDGHFISEKITFEKPSPQFFEYCICNLGEVSKSSILMVGDTPSSDILGAVNSGIDSCFYQRKKNVTCASATYTIQDISELINIV